MTAPLSPRSALPGLALALLLGANAHAQAIDPGLWEVQHDMQIPGQPNLAQQMQQMQEQMKNLPPEARKLMEQQMDASMGPGGALRICITPEEARGDVIREGQKEGDCTFTQVSHSGNVWKGRMVCVNPPSQGDFTTTLHSSSHYSTTAVLTSKEHGRIHMKTEARRMGGDCGKLARPAQGKKR